MAKARATRDLTKRQNEEGRRIYVRLLAERWDGNESEAAKELGVHASTLNKFRSGAQGTSRATLEAIHRLAGVAPGGDEIEPPALGELRAVPSTGDWDESTWKTLATLATASTDPLTAQDLFSTGTFLEAQRKGRAFAPRAVEPPTRPRR